MLGGCWMEEFEARQDISPPPPRCVLPAQSPTAANQHCSGWRRMRCCVLHHQDTQAETNTFGESYNYIILQALQTSVSETSHRPGIPLHQWPGSKGEGKTMTKRRGQIINQKMARDGMSYNEVLTVHGIASVENLKCKCEFLLIHFLTADTTNASSWNNKVKWEFGEIKWVPEILRGWITQEKNRKTRKWVIIVIRWEIANGRIYILQ